MAKIFISYRREDSQYQADKLHAALKSHVANPQTDIFIDIDDIPFGVDFVDHLDGKVGECEVLLALIGDRWLTVDPTTGKRRIDDPGDFVRIEIASALQRGIPVVPVLLDGAPVPGPDQLPDDLKALARRNGVPVQRLSFDADVARLVNGLPIELKPQVIAPYADDLVSHSPVVGQAEKTNGNAGLLIGSVVAILLIAGGGAVYMLDPMGWRGQQDVPTTEQSPPPLRPGQTFRDTLSGGGQGPEVVVVPSGSFTMGSPSSEAGRVSNEGPQRTVRINYQFAVGKTEVTWAEWEACVADGGCSNSGPNEAGGDEGWGKGSRPVINVIWEDAQAYVAWLSRKTGEDYRLLSEAEWEYVARAGSTGRFSWGDGDPTCSRDARNGANFRSCTSDRTEPVGYSAANAFGLHDVHGNVWEWTEDCYQVNYSGAPTNGSAFIVSDCSRRVLRGGAWVSNPQVLRSASRVRDNPTGRGSNVGFRVARTLD